MWFAVAAAVVALAAVAVGGGEKESPAGIFFANICCEVGRIRIKNYVKSFGSTPPVQFALIFSTANQKSLQFTPNKLQIIEVARTWQTGASLRKIIFPF